MAFESVKSIVITYTVANLAALRALASGGLVAEEQAFVEDTSVVVSWMPALLTPDNDPDGIIRPTDIPNDLLPGRWIYLTDFPG